MLCAVFSAHESCKGLKKVESIGAVSTASWSLLKSYVDKSDPTLNSILCWRMGVHKARERPHSYLLFINIF